MTKTSEELGALPISGQMSCDTREVASQSTLYTYLTQTFGHEWVVEQVEKLRKLPYKSDEYNAQKKKIPCATISCQCNGTRSRDNVIVRNPVICIDIDYGDNEKLMETPQKRQQLMEALFKSPCVYAAGTSCSGRGIFLIILLDSNNNQDEFEGYFRAIEKEFADNGIVIDKSCKDVTRLRIASSDRVLIKRGTIISYGRQLAPSEPQMSPQSVSRKRFCNGQADEEDLLVAVVELLICNGYRTDDYNDWMLAAFFLYPLGYTGWDLFDRISQQSAGYDARKAKEQFWKNARDTRQDIKSCCAHFFGIAKQVIGKDYAKKAKRYIKKKHNIK